MLTTVIPVELATLPYQVHPLQRADREQHSPEYVTDYLQAPGPDDDDHDPRWLDVEMEGLRAALPAGDP